MAGTRKLSVKRETQQSNLRSTNSHVSEIYLYSSTIDESRVTNSVSCPIVIGNDFKNVESPLERNDST